VRSAVLCLVLSAHDCIVCVVDIMFVSDFAPSHIGGFVSVTATPLT
jgi:hypothetical protein